MRSLPTRDYHVLARERKNATFECSGCFERASSRSIFPTPHYSVDCYGVLRQPYPLHWPLHHQHWVFTDHGVFSFFLSFRFVIIAKEKGDWGWLRCVFTSDGSLRYTRCRY